jgi:hypothetical protein
VLESFFVRKPESFILHPAGMNGKLKHIEKGMDADLVPPGY